jgi:hypothetical protein
VETKEIQFSEMRSCGGVAMKNFRLTLLIGWLSLLSFSQAVALQRIDGSLCTRTPEKTKAMIAELKQSFECSGLNFKDCNRYRAAVIGGVGAGLGGAMAAGLAKIKSHPEMAACLTPGGGIARFDLRSIFLGSPAFARAAAGGCRISKKWFADELSKLSKETGETATAAREKLIDELARGKPVSAEALRSIQIPEQAIKERALSGLDELVDLLSGNRATELVPHAGRREALLDTIQFTRERIAAASGRELGTELAALGSRVWLALPDESRQALSSMSYKFYNTTILNKLREEAYATLQREKVASVAAKLSETTLASQRLEILKAAGYTGETLEKLMGIDDVARAAQLTSSQLNIAVGDLKGGSLKSVDSLSPEDVTKFTKRYLGGLSWKPGAAMGLINHPIQFFSSGASVAKSLAEKVVTAGRAAAAELAAQIASEGALSFAGKTATKAALGTAKFAMAKGNVFFGALTFTRDEYCFDKTKSDYVQYAHVDGHCVAVGERTAKTDQFLYALSEREQIEEFKAHPDACEMLYNLYENYGPSHNWSASCEGDQVVLTGKDETTKGQTLRFSMAGGEPQSLEWFSEKDSGCTKLNYNDDKFVSAEVIDLDGPQKSCRAPAGRKAQTVGANLIGTRAPGAAVETARSLNLWKSRNSWTLSSAASCCKGSAGPLCPSGGSTGGTNPGSVR